MKSEVPGHEVLGSWTQAELQDVESCIYAFLGDRVPCVHWQELARLCISAIYLILLYARNWPQQIKKLRSRLVGLQCRRTGCEPKLPHAEIRLGGLLGAAAPRSAA